MPRASAARDRHRLSEHVAAALAEAIDRGRYQPGDRLPTEQSLAGSFKVSRTVVREAVAQLKFGGLVTTRQGSGAYITATADRSAFRISPECFAKRKLLVKFLEMRTAIESDAAALAARNRSRKDLAAIGGALDRMRSAHSAGRAAAERFVDAESEFYREIAAASKNEFFAELLQLIQSRMMSALRSVVVKNAMVAELSDAVVAEHETVYAAITQQRVEEARAAARLHGANAAARLMARADIKDV